MRCLRLGIRRDDVPTPVSVQSAAVFVAPVVPLTTFLTSVTYGGV